MREWGCQVVSNGAKRNKLGVGIGYSIEPVPHNSPRHNLSLASEAQRSLERAWFAQEVIAGSIMLDRGSKEMHGNGLAAWATLGLYEAQTYGKAQATNVGPRPAPAEPEPGVNGSYWQERAQLPPRPAPAEPEPGVNGSYWQERAQRPGPLEFFIPLLACLQITLPAQTLPFSAGAIGSNKAGYCTDF